MGSPDPKPGLPEGWATSETRRRLEKRAAWNRKETTRVLRNYVVVISTVALLVFCILLARR